MLVARNVEQAGETTSSWSQATGRRAVVAPADVTDADSIAAALPGDRPIDIVVNNAGGARFVAELADVERAGGTRRWPST